MADGVKNHGTIFLAILFIIRFAPAQSATYTSCAAGSAYQNPGYTYTLDTSVEPTEKIWSHCAFVNPLYDQVLCGRPEAADGTEFICDPDRIFSNVSIGNTVNAKLYAVQTDMATVCTDATGASQSFIVAVALVDRIREPDLQSADLCMNTCNELYPDLNTTVRVSTAGERDLIMENFGDSLRQLWGLGSCDNDVIIFYCKMYNKAYISRGARVSQYISDVRFEQLAAMFMTYVENGQLEIGLLLITADINSGLQRTDPAVVLLIVGMGVLLVFGVLTIYFVFIRSRYYNAWGWTLLN